MRRFLTFLIFISLSHVASSQNGTHNQNWWRPNGQVEVIEYDSSKNLVFLGGSFSEVSSTAKDYTILDIDNGHIKHRIGNQNKSSVSGFNVAIKDGNGGWYVGGRFNQIGDSTRYNIAHLDSTGKVLPGLGSQNGPGEDVRSMVLYEGELILGGKISRWTNRMAKYGALFTKNTTTVKPLSANPSSRVLVSIPDANGGFYIGGNFEKVGDSTRLRIAQIDSAGQLTAWKADIDGSVFSLHLLNNILYAGGTFNHVNGLSRRGFVAIDALSGEVKSLNPPLIGSVKSIESIGDTLYVGGLFNLNGSASSTHLASINLLTNQLTGWTAGINGNVEVLKIYQDKLFVGGRFSAVRGNRTSCLIKYDVKTGNLVSWKVQFDTPFRYINDFEIINDTIYLAGRFDSLNGLSRLNLAAMSIEDSVVSNWNPSTSGLIYSIKQHESNLIVGGLFNSIGGVQKENLALIKISNGQVDNWHPEPNNQVNTISVSTDSCIYVGGDFNQIGGIKTGSLISVDPIQGNLNSFLPDLNGTVSEVLLLDSNLYVGGSFSNAFGQSANNLISINLKTKSLNNWFPNPDRTVLALEHYRGQILVGGVFNSISNTAKSNLASISATNATVKNWTPNPSDYVSDLVVVKDTLYVGGGFNSISGNNRTSLASYDLSNDNLTTLNLSISGQISSLHYADQKLYLGGQFIYTSNQQEYRHLMAYDPVRQRVDGNFTPNPTKDNGRIGLIASGINNDIIVSGIFHTIGEHIKRNSIVALDVTNGKPSNWNPKCNDNAIINDIKIADSLIYIAGVFTSLGNSNRNHIAQLSAQSGKVKQWNPLLASSGSVVNSIELYDGKVFVAGKFATQAFDRFNFATYDQQNASLDTFVVTIPSGQVFNKLKVIDSILYVGGSFSTVNASVQTNFAAINLIDGKTIVTPNFNHTVYTIESKDSLIFIGGKFTEVNAESRPFFAAIDKSNHQLDSFKLDFDLEVRDMTFEKNSLFVAGHFTMVNNKPSMNLVEIDLPSKQVFTWQGLSHLNQAVERVNNLILIGGRSPISFGAYGDPISTSLFEFKNKRFLTKFLNVYPNPTASIVNIERNSSEASVLRLFDLSGRLLKQSLIQNRIVELDLSGLRMGVYILNIDGASKRIIKK